jgi:hypothetical protein
MRIRFSNSTGAVLLLLALLRANGFGETRSDPQTEGEKRLLEWDTTKKFIPGRSAFNGGVSKGTAAVPVSSFGTRSFISGKSVDTSSFYTPEFLSPTAGAAQKSFATSSAYTAKTSALDAAFNSGREPVQNRNFSGGEKTARVQTGAADAGRPYLGPEADKMKQKYTPETGPKGGIITGHQLSIEEVRAILNRNK